MPTTTTKKKPAAKQSNVVPLKTYKYGKTGHVTVLPTTVIEGKVPPAPAASSAPPKSNTTTWLVLGALALVLLSRKR